MTLSAAVSWLIVLAVIAFAFASGWLIWRGDDDHYEDDDQ